MRSFLGRPGAGAVVAGGALGFASALVAASSGAPGAALADAPRAVGASPAALILTIDGKQAIGHTREDGRPPGASDVTAFNLSIGRHAALQQDLLDLWGSSEKGKRPIGHATLVKEIDAASPDIARALVAAVAEGKTPAPAVEIELRFYRPRQLSGDAPRTSQSYAIRLRGVRIDSVEQRLSPTVPRGGDTFSELPTETLSISFTGYDAVSGDPDAADAGSTK